MFLALAGVNELQLFDSDDVSIHNLNRLPLGPASVNKNKAVALAEFLQKLRPELEIYPRTNFNPDMPGHLDILERSSWVVCSTDSLKSRRMVYALSKMHNAHYIECGAEGHGASVSFCPADFATAEEELPGYRSVPVFVGPCTLAASIAAYYILLGLGGGMDRSFNIGWNGAEQALHLATILDNEPEEEEEELVITPDGVEDGLAAEAQ